MHDLIIFIDRFLSFYETLSISDEKKLINDEKIDFVSRISVFIEISYEFYLNYSVK